MKYFTAVFSLTSKYRWRISCYIMTSMSSIIPQAYSVDFSTLGFQGLYCVARTVNLLCQPLVLRIGSSVLWHLLPFWRICSGNSPTEHGGILSALPSRVFLVSRHQSSVSVQEPEFCNPKIGKYWWGGITGSSKL